MMMTVVTTVMANLDHNLRVCWWREWDSEDEGEKEQ